MVHLIKKITVFTPTYNRAYIIKDLYESLLNQINCDFEWLIVDDGSMDNTDELVASFIAEDKIQISYFKTTNGGKHRAINKGVTIANSELFCIVDSDDTLADNAIERILFYYDAIKHDNVFAGVSGLRAFHNGGKIGGEENWNIIDCNSLDLRYRFKVKGDMAEVYRTNILKEFPFPEIDGEFFCAESTVWNRISQKYKLRYFYEKIYLCDYLPDGLTSKITKLRMDSCEASLINYSELFNMQIPFLQKIKAATNFWRFSFYSKRRLDSFIKQIGIASLICYPFGFLLHLKDLHQ